MIPPATIPATAPTAKPAVPMITAGIAKQQRRYRSDNAAGLAAHFGAFYDRTFYRFDNYVHL